MNARVEVWAAWLRHWPHPSPDARPILDELIGWARTRYGMREAVDAAYVVCMAYKDIPVRFVAPVRRELSALLRSP